MALKKNERLEQAFAALLHEDDAQVLEALARIDREGDARAILPLLRALVGTNDEDRRKHFRAMLFQVKAEGAGEQLSAALGIPELRSERKTILAAFWNAGVDASPYTEQILAVAVEGDAEEIFECLTVLENQETLPEKPVLKGIRALGKAIADNTDEYRGAMLGSLLVELQARVGR